MRAIQQSNDTENIATCESSHQDTSTRYDIINIVHRCWIARKSDAILEKSA
jgi:hypothetical protein